MGFATRATRVAVVHAAAGWMGAAVLIASDRHFTWLDAATSATSLRAAIITAACGLLTTRVYTADRFRWWFGPFLGIIVGLGAVFTYFALWPHSWQASRLEAWKTGAVIVGVYWDRLLPLALVAGGVAAWWSAQPVRPPRWVRLEDEDEATDASTSPPST